MTLPQCPQCDSEYTYQDGEIIICPECSYEWNQTDDNSESEGIVVKDANGILLTDGDSITLIKDLKVKNSSTVIKQGTKAKSIHLQDGDHNIACKIDGISMNLKSEFVKKV